MRCIAIFFLLIGAFLLEWSEHSFSKALYELKVYWRTRNYCNADADEESWR